MREVSTTVGSATRSVTGPDSVARDVATFAGSATAPQAPKDFVTATRGADDSTYLDVGVTPSKRALTPKTPAELAAFQAGLEKRRDASATYAKRPPPPMPVIAQPRRLPKIPGDTLSPPEADALPGEAATIPVPQRLRPKRIDEN